MRSPAALIEGVVKVDTEPMDADDLLRFDYEQTAGQISALTDLRFKLLGFVPTIATAAVAIVSSSPSTGTLLSVGLLGTLATVGILLYELRNTQALDLALGHVAELRGLLGLDMGRPAHVSTEPAIQGRLFGAAPIGQDEAVGLVYGAALGGWIYLLTWGALRGLGVSGARPIGGVIAVCCTIAVVVEVGRISGEAKRATEQVPAGPRPGTT
jgi:hypothetical protein